MSMLDKLRKMRIKRFVCAASTPTEYTLIGIWAFTEKGIRRKLHRLAQCGIEYEPLWSNARYVDKFPSYLDPRRIY